MNKTKKITIFSLLILILVLVVIFTNLKTYQEELPILSLTPAYKISDGAMRSQVLLNTNGHKINQLDIYLRYNPKKLRLVDRDDLAKGIQPSLKSEMGDIKNMHVDEVGGNISFTIVTSGGVEGETLKVAALDFDLMKKTELQFDCNSIKAVPTTDINKKLSLKCISQTLTPAS